MDFEGDEVSKKKIQIQVSARALVVKDRKLLLVGHTPEYWYTPGGRLEAGESLTNCIAREVFEETGLKVKAGELVHVFEFYDDSEKSHKVECYFLAFLEEGSLPLEWTDLGGEVKYRKFFTLEEIRQRQNILPSFLSKGFWLKENRTSNEIYQGLELKECN
jgi:ADP-ribose pyrophosphatase YjhB (NUDIX family)